MCIISKNGDQIKWIVNILHAFIINLKILDGFPYKEQTESICIVGTPLDLKKMKEYCEGRLTFFILTPVLKDFDEQPTYWVQLKRDDHQMIQDTYFKIIEGKMIAYDGEQAFLERNNTPIILVVDPLIFT